MLPDVQPQETERVLLMANNSTVLVIEDEADLADVLRYNFERQGYVCKCVHDGRDALTEVARHPPDVVILDRLLPGLSGDELISRLRQDPKTAAMPILLLTAKAEESDELVGFALGADDYVTKPFSMKVLMARVDALLRRASTPPDSQSDTYVTGPVALDRSRREVRVDDRIVALTATEFEILWALAAAKGRILTRARLIQQALGACAVVSDRTIDVHVVALRKKLGHAAGLIHTVRGAGYALRAQPTEEK